MLSLDDLLGVRNLRQQIAKMIACQRLTKLIQYRTADNNPLHGSSGTTLLTFRNFTYRHSMNGGVTRLNHAKQKADAIPRDARRRS